MNTLDSPATSPPQPQSFLFGKIYVGICFFGCVIAGCLAVAAGLYIVQTGDWLNNATTQRNTSQLLAMILMIVLWSSTGIAILRRKRRALILSYIGAVVAVIGIIVRGFIPLDIILAIPTFSIIPYLRHRSSLLA
jgi:magnesium-transporting ATPase (P-type)